VQRDELGGDPGRASERQPCGHVACLGEEAAGGPATHDPADLACFAGIEKIQRRIEAESCPIDILRERVRQPGQARPLEETSEEGWRAVDGNPTATFLTLKSVLPGMKERGTSCVITMSSAAARRPHLGSPIAYAAAKAGIELLTKGVAAQAGPFGIRADCIAPDDPRRGEPGLPATGEAGGAAAGRICCVASVPRGRLVA
jgi:NAD(P)-dependent dehydrogenase (short-subunit alcohol dehydrogenase family)